MNCPECDTQVYGTTCECGWKMPEKTPEQHNTDHLAEVTAYRDAKALEEARQWNQAHGLDTLEKQIAFVKSMRRRTIKRMT